MKCKCIYTIFNNLIYLYLINKIIRDNVHNDAEKDEYEIGRFSPVSSTFYYVLRSLSLPL
jgi:hypothetical protein